MIRCALLVFFFVLSFSCAKESSAVNLQKENDSLVSPYTETILFIGNSHTYYNEGIATHLTRFRTNDVDKNPLIEELAKGGYSLQDHLADPGTKAKIEERNWDIIVLQENTSVAAEELPSTIEALQSFATMVAQKGTKVFLFMTWPYKDRPDMLMGIQNTYTKGASEIGATLVPVGADWMDIDSDEEISVSLYDQDGIHPSLEGTFYTAAMFYRAIFVNPPSNNPYQAGLSSEVANYLKTKAD